MLILRSFCGIQRLINKYSYLRGKFNVFSRTVYWYDTVFNKKYTAVLKIKISSTVMVLIKMYLEVTKIKEFEFNVFVNTSANYIHISQQLNIVVFLQDDLLDSVQVYSVYEFDNIVQCN